MLNEPRKRVTTYPGTGQVVTAPGASCNVHGWLYHMYYNYTGVLRNIIGVRANIHLEGQTEFCPNGFSGGG